MPMTDTAPLTFTDDQLLEALKAAPDQIQSSVAIIAMQLELTQRREADSPEGE